MNSLDDKFVVIDDKSSSTEKTVDPQAQVDSTTEKPPTSVDAPPLPSGISAAVLSGYVGNFYRVVEGVANVLQDEELALPQIVVIGQESSGKSSVLESLAMMPLFPRDRDLCTRMPIHLKMRHVSQAEADESAELMPHRPPLDTHQIKMKLVYADGREPVESEKNFTAEEAAELMSKWMEQIITEEDEEKKLQGVADHVLEIEVRSSKVPNLNLIDLPGIVAGRLVDEPDDMMQRTRALVEKYLQLPHTLVLAVIPAFERVRNSQAFQLVQQFNLMDKTIGVLTMVDRAMDATDPEGPLGEVKNRLDGTSRDIVYLKEGYVAVMNRDTRLSPELALDEFKAEENAWLEENLPGYIGRGLASSSVLATKLEKMLADHVRASWVPQTLEKINSERTEVGKDLLKLGPEAEKVVSNFQASASRTAAYDQMMEIMTPILPGLLKAVDADILQLTALIHDDFLHSRKEHKLILAATEEKKQRFVFSCLLAPAQLLMDSQRMYLADHLDQILKNIVLAIVNLVQKMISTPVEPKDQEISTTFERFSNLHLFFSGILWERLNELLLNEEELLQRLEKSFLEFDPDQATMVKIPNKVQLPAMESVTELKSLACSVELYLSSKGFNNSSFNELYLSQQEWKEDPLSRGVARLVISSVAPTLTPAKASASTWTFPTQPDKPQPIPTQFGFGTTASVIPPKPTPVWNAPVGSRSVSEFDSRLYFALTTHVVTPLLKSISDVSELTRKMQQYVVCTSKDKANDLFLFRESTSDERKKLKKVMEQLDAAAKGLQATSSFP
ncbi:hypothetical protein V7S43_017543 [Phytophthora oleae]|uniref:Dynamin-type G domain-containing protein n=1 Tax=Phytophthora oleae TaxID=2107226 RepID=A0ABD3ETA2_9STRA